MRDYVRAIQAILCRKRNKNADDERELKKIVHRKEEYKIYVNAYITCAFEFKSN